MNTHPRSSLALIAWLAAVALPTAQAALPSSTQLDPGKIPVAGNGNFIVIGCVARESAASPQLTITDSRATPPAKFRLAGDPDFLKLHVGHTVEVGGPITPAAAGGGVPTVKVLSLTYVSTKCEKLK